MRSNFRRRITKLKSHAHDTKCPCLVHAAVLRSLVVHKDAHLVRPRGASSTDANPETVIVCATSSVPPLPDHCRPGLPLLAGPSFFGSRRSR